MENKYYYIRTYGCQMNVHESEKLAGMLKSLGYTETTDEKQADVIVYNTCCIRDGVEKKIFGNVGSLKTLKKSKPNLVIALCGCLTQESGKSDYIKEKYPQVNIVFGTHNINDFKNYLIEFNDTHKNIYDVWEKEGLINEDVDMYRTSGNNAWVNINYGCNNFCTYCIVPYVRGRERSRDMNDILKEVKALVKEKYAVITLLGQNVNSYGNDIDDEKYTFANLLREICKIDGNFKVKFMSSHPKDLSLEVIDVIAKEDKMSKTIHLPVQSGSNRILEKMNRKYTVEHYLSLIDAIRERIPDAHITTDMIVGFPGETEEDFMDTYHLVEKVRYSGVFAFMYSKRKGTVAETMENQVPEEIKNERVNRLLKLSKSIIKEQTREYLNKTYPVLIECKNDDGSYNAILDSGKNITIKGDLDIEIGQYCNADILEEKNGKLFGVKSK